MAVVTVKSVSVTNQDASPRVAQQAGVGGGGRMKKYDDFFTITNGDSIASKYLVLRVPSNSRVKHITVENAAIAGAIGDVGVYYAATAQDCAVGITPGTVIDADFFASAYSFVAGQLVPIDVTFEGGFYTLANRVKPLWEAVGLTSDPGGKFDIVVTLTAAATATGNAYLDVTCVDQ
jgi:hypothetical protein